MILTRSITVTCGADRCERCQRATTVVVRNEHELTRELRKVGWTPWSDCDHICPECTIAPVAAPRLLVAGVVQ